MIKQVSFKLLFISCITTFSLLILYGCNGKKSEEYKVYEHSEEIEKIKGVAALGQLNPLGEVRKLAAPTSGMGGTPRLSKLLIREGDSIYKDQILAVFDNRPKLEANLKSAQANLNIYL